MMNKNNGFGAIFPSFQGQIHAQFRIFALLLTIVCSHYFGSQQAFNFFPTRFMEYNFGDIEKKWQQRWIADGTYQVSNDPSRPKFYVLDMFPYPSGTGLHVGHPLGYIASDIYARYKRLKGFNVLHPMGYDAFGLPAEQYAIDHGIHPAISTTQNISNFREQLDRIGFSFDWSREVNTAEPGYYKWTQWIFLQLFNSWYNRQKARARPVSELIAAFDKEGSISVAGYRPIPAFTADEWKAYSEK